MFYSRTQYHLLIKIKLINSSRESHELQRLLSVLSTPLHKQQVYNSSYYKEFAYNMCV